MGIVDIPITRPVERQGGRMDPEQRRHPPVRKLLIVEQTPDCRRLHHLVDQLAAHANTNITTNTKATHKTMPVRIPAGLELSIAKKLHSMLGARLVDVGEPLPKHLLTGLRIGMPAGAGLEPAQRRPGPGLKPRHDASPSRASPAWTDPTDPQAASPWQHPRPRRGR